MIKVAIVDDHKLFRQGLAVMLAEKEDIEVVQKFPSAIELLKYLPSLKVDLILLDIDMPEMDGITAVPKIFALRPKLKIAILSMHLNYLKIEEAMAAKVQGYLLKTSGDDEVTAAIREICSGKSFFAKDVHEELVRGEEKKAEMDYLELTPREKEILLMVCDEYNSPQIAEKLGISVHTAETHRRNLLSKTGCKNSVGLVKYAMENDFL